MTSDWAEFAAAGAVFLVSHSVPLRPPVRPLLEKILGRHGFLVAYSALSVAILAWLFLAAGRAPYVALWAWAPWQNHAVLVAMAVVCLILAFSLGRPNPFSFGGSTRPFAPTRPGIVRWTRHPLLIALFLWSIAHTIPNGDLAHVLLFGSFAGFALLGTHMVDRRKQREMGTRWDELRRKVSEAPLLIRPTNVAGAVIRGVTAALGYVALLWVHPFLFGVDPLG